LDEAIGLSAVSVAVPIPIVMMRIPSALAELACSSGGLAIPSDSSTITGSDVEVCQLTTLEWNKRIQPQRHKEHKELILLCVFVVNLYSELA
jgi:hypothetical protein